MRHFLWILTLALILPAVGYAEKDINGLKILSTLEELADPAHTALMIIDMQNEIVSTQGGYARFGKSAEAKAEEHEITPQYAQQVKNIKRLLDAARKAKLHIAYVEFIHLDESGKMLVNGPEMWCHRDREFVSLVAGGTWEAKTIKELEPQEGDIVLYKSRANAFHNPNLDDLLRERSIKNLLITGTATGGCVLGTAIGGMTRDYYPVFIGDCIDQKESPLYEWLRNSPMPMHSSQEIMAVWEKMGDKESKESVADNDESGERP